MLVFLPSLKRYRTINQGLNVSRTVPLFVSAHNIVLCRVEYNNIHMKLGISCILIACLQASNGYLRPKKTSRGEHQGILRSIWECFHLYDICKPISNSTAFIAFLIFYVYFLNQEVLDWLITTSRVRYLRCSPGFWQILVNSIWRSHA